MGLSELGFALGGLFAGGGIWSVLRIVARCCAAIALERTRAASVARMIEQLPPGGTFHESDSDGRFWTITIPGPPEPTAHEAPER